MEVIASEEWKSINYQETHGSIPVVRYKKNIVLSKLSDALVVTDKRCVQGNQISPQCNQISHKHRKFDKSLDDSMNNIMYIVLTSSGFYGRCTSAPTRAK